MAGLRLPAASPWPRPAGGTAPAGRVPASGGRRTAWSKSALTIQFIQVPGAGYQGAGAAAAGGGSTTCGGGSRKGPAPEAPRRPGRGRGSALPSCSAVWASSSCLPGRPARRQESGFSGMCPGGRSWRGEEAQILPVPLRPRPELREKQRRRAELPAVRPGRGA